MFKFFGKTIKRKRPTKFQSAVLAWLMQEECIIRRSAGRHQIIYKDPFDDEGSDGIIIIVQLEDLRDLYYLTQKKIIRDKIMLHILGQNA